MLSLKCLSEIAVCKVSNKRRIMWKTDFGLLFCFWLYSGVYIIPKVVSSFLLFCSLAIFAPAWWILRPFLSWILWCKMRLTLKIVLHLMIAILQKIIMSRSFILWKSYALPLLKVFLCFLVHFVLYLLLFGSVFWSFLIVLSEVQFLEDFFGNVIVLAPLIFIYSSPIFQRIVQMTVYILKVLKVLFRAYSWGLIVRMISFRQPNIDSFQTFSSNGHN